MVDVNEKVRRAAKAGSEVKLRALLHEPECDALAKDHRGMTALMVAACHGHEACVGLLLPKSDALAKDKGGLTALMWAARYSYETCVGLLLPASDALAQDDQGTTALIWSVLGGDDACVGLFLLASDALARDNNGFTASGLASKHGHESLAQFIDAYALAQREQAALGVAVCSGAPRGRAAPRV